MLLPNLQKIKELQDAGADLDEEQEALIESIDAYLEDFWYEVSDGHPKRLNDWLAEPFLTEFRAAVATIKKGFTALESLAEGI